MIATGFAQDGVPVYSDYLSDNLYLLHPSMAGAANANQIRLTARQQWFDVEDAPNLQTLSVNGRLGERTGVGAIAFSDENGYFSQKGLYGTLAYHLLLSRNVIDLNQLSFGVNVGIIQNILDETSFDMTDFDPLINGGSQSDVFFNVDIGMSYYLLDFYAHATVKNLAQVKKSFYNGEGDARGQRNYILSAGYVLGRYGSLWKYEPSLMFQAKEKTGESALDVNFKVYREFDWGQLWGGLSYRRSLDGAEYINSGNSVKSQKLDYITPIIGINYGNFLFAYTYSYQNNNIVLSNSFHQITLGYDFGKRREPYDCNCPAIN